MKVFAMASLAFAAGAALAESPADFPASATVVVSGGEGLHRVEVPFETHRAARPDLADLRMFNGRGDALPFAFAGSAPVVAPQLQAVALPLFPVRATPKGKATEPGDVSLDVRADANGTLVALRTSPKGAPKAKPAERPVAWVADASGVSETVGALVVDWAAGAGSEIARVSVEASEDLKSWSPLASGTVLLLEQGGRKLSQPRIEFGARKVKYLRVTSSTESFVLAGLSAEPTKPVAAPELHTVTVGGRAGGPPGEYTYDLQAAVPVVRIQLLLPEANAVAPAEIFSRNDGGEWRTVGSATFYRMSRGGEEVRSQPVAVNSPPARYWRVRIDPKAGVPRDAPRLEAGFRPRQVVFASRGEGPYLLAFGNDQAKRADLPLATLIPSYQPDAEYKLPLAKVSAVGMHAPETGFSLSRFWQGDKGRKVVLWSVLIGGVLILGFMAWGLSRKVN